MPDKRGWLFDRKTRVLEYNTGILLTITCYSKKGVVVEHTRTSVPEGRRKTTKGTVSLSSRLVTISRRRRLVVVVISQWRAMALHLSLIHI